MILNKKRLSLTALLLIFASCSSGTPDNGVPAQSAFTNFLRSFDNSLNEILRKLTEEFSAGLFFALLGIAFVYGIVHSLGPGHGKTLIASFFLKEKHPLRKSLLLALIVSAVHSGSAVILSFIFTLVIKGLRGIFKIQMQGYFMTASGILILIIGVVFLIIKILHRHREKPEYKGNTRLVLVGISAGIVPCPVALMIMMLTIPRGIFYIGLAAVLFISLGMFLLLSATGVIAILARNGILKIADKTVHQAEKVSSVVEYISIAFIILIGLFMML